MPERVPHSHGAAGNSRLLIEKRCEVYSRVATLVMDVEEALDEDDGLRARYVLKDIRRCLRSSLAFLTDQVFQELERIEALSEFLPKGEGRVPAEVLGELSDRLQLLHVKLARSLTLPHLQDLEQIVGLSPRLKKTLALEERELEAREERRTLEEQCWRYESEAREMLAKKLYHKAIKSLRKAVRLDPTRAVLHNDLGVVFSLQDKNTDAVGEYRTAVALNERYPDRRTEEWTTSYYNLGIALRKSAQTASVRQERQETVVHLREAREAFLEYTRLNATGAKVNEARDVVDKISVEILRFEAREGLDLT